MYIINTNHNIIHKETCGSVLTMKEENKQYCDDIPRFCVPCNHCKPHLDKKGDTQ